MQNEKKLSSYVHVSGNRNATNVAGRDIIAPVFNISINLNFNNHEHFNSELIELEISKALESINHKIKLLSNGQ